MTVLVAIALFVVVTAAVGAFAWLLGAYIVGREAAHDLDGTGRDL